MIVWISVSNSDDRLSSILWAEYIKEVDKVISHHVFETHAAMVHSLPTSHSMDCHWCVDLGKGTFMQSNLVRELTKVAKVFRQDKIVWYECKATHHILGVDNELE